jgi:hypothetical protein
MLFPFACEAAGATGIRLSLRPLLVWGFVSTNSGESRRENAFACSELFDISNLDAGARLLGLVVMPGLVPGIHVLCLRKKERGWPGQARP